MNEPRLHFLRGRYRVFPCGGSEFKNAWGEQWITNTSSGVNACNGSVRTYKLTELLVHIVGTATRVVTDPDTEVLDLQRALLVDDVKTDDLAVGFLDFLELRKEVPEARLGDDFIGREDAHAVELGRGLRLCGEMATDDLVFFETHLQS